jgi:hypothetical protein
MQPPRSRAARGANPRWVACPLCAGYLDTGGLRPTVQTGFSADRLVEDVGNSLPCGGLRGIRHLCGGDERFWSTMPDRLQRWYQPNPLPGGGLGTNPHDQPVEVPFLAQIGVTRSLNYLAVEHISSHMVVSYGVLCASQRLAPPPSRQPVPADECAEPMDTIARRAADVPG